MGMSKHPPFLLANDCVWNKIFGTSCSQDLQTCPTSLKDEKNFNDLSEDETDLYLGYNPPCPDLSLCRDLISLLLT